MIRRRVAAGTNPGGLVAMVVDVEDQVVAVVNLTMDGPVEQIAEDHVELTRRGGTVWLFDGDTGDAIGILIGE